MSHGAVVTHCLGHVQSQWRTCSVTNQRQHRRIRTHTYTYTCIYIYEQCRQWSRRKPFYFLSALSLFFSFWATKKFPILLSRRTTNNRNMSNLVGLLCLFVYKTAIPIHLRCACIDGRQCVISSIAKNCQQNGLMTFC